MFVHVYWVYLSVCVHAICVHSCACVYWVHFPACVHVCIGCTYPRVYTCVLGALICVCKCMCVLCVLMCMFTYMCTYLCMCVLGALTCVCTRAYWVHLPVCVYGNPEADFKYLPFLLPFEMESQQDWLLSISPGPAYSSPLSTGVSGMGCTCGFL